MFHKSKNLVVYTSLLYVILCITTAFFINVNHQKVFNKNLISQNAFRLEVTNLSETPLHVSSIKEGLELIDEKFLIYKSLINDGAAIYTNDSVLADGLPSGNYSEFFSKESNNILLSDNLKGDTINNKFNISNINFDVLDFYKYDPKLSTFFINLFGTDFSKRDYLAGIYYIDTNSRDKNIIIEKVTNILNSFSDKISFNITTLERNPYTKFVSILLSQGIIGPIFIFLIFLAIFNLANSILNWINNNKPEIFCRKVVGATNMKILLQLIFVFLKISIISFIIGGFTSVLVLNFFPFKDIYVYYNFLFFSLLILFVIQILLILVHYILLISKKKIICLVKRGINQ